MHAKRNGYSFSYREVNFFRSSISSCIEEIQEGIKKQKTIIILGGSEENCKKLKNIFNEKDIGYKQNNNKTRSKCLQDLTAQTLIYY